MSKILPPWRAVQELEFTNDALRYERDLMRAHIRFLESRCAGLEKELAETRESREFRQAREIRSRREEKARLSFRLERAWLKLRPMDICSRLRRTYRLLEKYRDILADRDPERGFLRRRDVYERLAAVFGAPPPPAELPLTSVIVLYDGDPGHLARCRLSDARHDGDLVYGYRQQCVLLPGGAVGC